MFTKLNVLLGIDCQENASSLTRCLWFNDKSWLGLLAFYLYGLDILAEIVGIAWEKPSLWVEVKFIGELTLHLIKRLPKLILSCKNKHSWKVIHTLVSPKPEETVWTSSGVTPVYIKFLYPWNLETRRRLLFFY